MLVAVTGASGFVGTHLVNRLLDEGMAVRALSHRAPVSAQEGLEIVRGGLDDDAALAALVDGADAVIHCGGLVAAPSDSAFHEVNTEGTRRLAEAAAQAGVPRFLLISSMAARHPELSAYAASKRAAEVALARIEGLNWDALRPPAVYGPGDRQVLIFFRLLRRGIGLLPAGETARVSLIHVEDLVSAATTWLTAAEPSGEIYELGDGKREGYAWRTIIDAAARELIVQPRYMTPPRAMLGAVSHLGRLWGRLSGRAPFLTPGKLREIRHPDWVCRDERFRRLTGWRPRVALGEGLRKTVAWYRAHGWL